MIAAVSATSPSVRSTAGLLRRFLTRRNQRFAREHALPHALSYGSEPVVVYSPTEQGLHGNFFPDSYQAILKNSAWQKRLRKAHTGRRHIPKGEHGAWCELDSCTSSDALLMNVFCHPRALAEGRLHRLMNVDLEVRPEFGVRTAVALENGNRDRTEVDMRFGDVLVEAKLTESGFQSCRAAIIEGYRDFVEVFDRLRLPRAGDGYISYQLLRNVMAAQQCGDRFCVIIDARRIDLREQWCTVMQCVRDYELKLRCQILTWQEITAVLPEPLQNWLAEKYGIFASGTEPQMDAEEWYW